MMKKKRCVMCDKGKLSPGKTIHRIQVGKICFDGELPAQHCSNCGEVYIDGLMLKRFEFLVAKQLADNAQRTPEAFLFMRKALGMRAVDLAVLIGVGAETISRYETGTREIDPIRFGVLVTLVLDELSGHDEARARFMSVQRPVKPMPRKVALKVA